MRHDLFDSANVPEAQRLLLAACIVLFLFAAGVI